MMVVPGADINVKCSVCDGRIARSDIDEVKSYYSGVKCIKCAKFFMY